MKVTEENRNKIRAFIRIMAFEHKAEEGTIGMIIAMLKNEKQMDELVEYSEKHPNADQWEIFDKAEEIAG